MDTYILHICSEIRCKVFLFGEEKGIVRPGECFDIEVSIGEQELLFVSVADKKYRYQLCYTVEDTKREYKIFIKESQFGVTREILESLILEKEHEISIQKNNYRLQHQNNYRLQHRIEELEYRLKGKECIYNSIQHRIEELEYRLKEKEDIYNSISSEIDAQIEKNNRLQRCIEELEYRLKEKEDVYNRISSERTEKQSKGTTSATETKFDIEDKVCVKSDVIDQQPRIKRRKKNLFPSIFSFKKKMQEDEILYNEVYGSVFAPAEVKKKTHLLIQVYIHFKEDEEQMIGLAQEVQKEAQRFGFIPLSGKIKEGDMVEATLSIYGEKLITTDKKTIKWRAPFAKCTFDYFVPRDIDEEELSCKIELAVNNVPVGEMQFITKIVERPVKEQSEISARNYNKVFISYSHKDESKVKLLAEGYRGTGTDYFFDRHYLKAGDVFPQKIQDYINSADLFILCWSKNAAESEYVKKELAMALERVYPKVQPMQDVKLAIRPYSLKPRAELPEEMRDYYHIEEL